jgi:hypothetical protein
VVAHPIDTEQRGRLEALLRDGEHALAADGTLSDAGLPSWLALAVPLSRGDECTM